MSVRTYTTHDIANGFNSLPSQVFVRQEDYDALSAVVHELRGYIEDLKRSRQQAEDNYSRLRWPDTTGQ